MKPWFEREAKIIKFPEPEKKVIQMPNVASYPDFITGVADLKARMGKGEISQASHDKLYTDLIHRFMRKESFETPWFLRENTISSASNVASANLYINAVNQLLQKNTPIPYGRDGQSKFVANPGQSVKDMKSTLTGKLNNKPKTVIAGQIYKSSTMRKGQKLKSGEAKKTWNAGGVSEGLFGMGLWLGFLANRKINNEDIKNGIAKYLKSNGTVVGPVVNKVSEDKFSLLIKLSPIDWEGLIHKESLNHPSVEGHAKSIANYVNNSEDFQKIRNDFINDKNIDYVEVIADGVSTQKATTVDVYIKYADGKKVKFERSIKSGQVKQFGQGPSPILGKVEKDDATYSREHRWHYQENFWENLGVDISSAEDMFIGYKTDISNKLSDKGQDNLTKKELDLAMEIDREILFFSYKAAVDDFNKKLKGDKNERIVVRNLFDALKEFAGAKMVHIYSGGYRVMDFNKLNDMVKKLDLKAFLVGEDKPPIKTKYPKVIVGTDNTPAGTLVSITVKTDTRKASNQVDMGRLLKKITSSEPPRDN